VAVGLVRYGGEPAGTDGGGQHRVAGSAHRGLEERRASDDPSALIGLPLIRLTDMLLAEGVTIL